MLYGKVEADRSAPRVGDTPRTLAGMAFFHAEEVEAILSRFRWLKRVTFATAFRQLRTEAEGR